MEEAQITDKPKIYQAMGILSGILELAEDDNNSRLVVGKQTYLVEVPWKVRNDHKPGELQKFKVYPVIIEDKLGFSLDLVTKKERVETGMILKGCWEIQEEEPRLVIYRNRVIKEKKARPTTVLPLIWKEAPVADGQYWEIKAKLKGYELEVVQAIGSSKPPQKYKGQSEKTFENAKSDLSPPVLRGARYTNITSELPPPVLRSVTTSIAMIAPEAIDESANGVVKSLISGASVEVEEINIEAKAVDIIEPSVASEHKAIEPNIAEPKKTKDKVKSSRSKKQMSLTADRLFLGKQLSSGK